jgi:signal transduction histidine kinase
LNGFSTSHRRLSASRVATEVIVAIGAILAVCGVVEARAERTLSQYLRDRWEGDRGFPGGRVYSISQTTDGYLWIGTEKGLVRFDGLTFQLVQPDDTANGLGPTVLGVAGAPDGSVWARLRGPVLVRYHKGTFENLLARAGVRQSVVSAMTPGPDATMLLATLESGAMLYRAGTFEGIAPPSSLTSSSFVISMAAGPGGETWLGTRDAGLLRVQRGTITRVTLGLPDLKINSLLPVENGGLWIGTDKGIARWDGAAVSPAGVPQALRDVPALGMVRDAGGNVWVAAGARGVVRLGVDGRVSADERTQASTVFEDREGNLWVGTDHGIERWRDPLFVSYSTVHGLPSASTGSIFVDRHRRTWFAPTEGGLFWMHDSAIHRVSEAGLADDVVYSIDGRGDEVWIGRRQGGLTRIRLEGTTVQARRYSESDGLAQDSVYAVHVAPDGAVWAGTLNAGASRLHDGVFTRYNAGHGLPSNTVTAIAGVADGAVWLGTPNGLASWSKGRTRTYTTADGLPSSDISAIAVTAAGQVWVGTAAGLAAISGARVQPLGALPAPLRSAILGLAEDRSGGLWVATPDRILRVDGRKVLGGTATEADVREYAPADGLLATEGVKRHRTVVSDPDGRIWFALNRGLSVADPARADRGTLPALTHVERVSADGVSIPLTDAISLPSERRRITFDYAGLSLSAPERVRFRYRLDGFDGEWSAPVTERQAAYTNLRPGTYRFRVMASAADGSWNSSEAAVALEILPMFWQTAWFQTGAIVTAIVAAWGAYRLRMRQVARRLSLRFEERLAERTHIAQELHDTLLQGFMSASMQLHVTVDRLPHDSPARAPLARVLELMTKVTNEGRNAVRGLRAPGASPEELEKAFAVVQQEIAPSTALRVIVEGHPRPLQPIVRDEVYRIGREALTNAFRHSEGRSVEVALEYAARELRVFVRDDGRGIDAEVLQTGSDGHWGLTGMRERAERIGATLKIRSRSAAGTEVELKVPAHAAFDTSAAGAGQSRLAAVVARMFHRTTANGGQKQP